MSYLDIHNPAGNYMFKVNNRTRCEICSKLTIKTPEERPCSNVSVVNFEQVNADWAKFLKKIIFA